MRCIFFHTIWERSQGLSVNLSVNPVVKHGARPAAARSLPHATGSGKGRTARRDVNQFQV